MGAALPEKPLRLRMGSCHFSDPQYDGHDQTYVQTYECEDTNLSLLHGLTLLIRIDLVSSLSPLLQRSTSTIAPTEINAADLEISHVTL